MHVNIIIEFITYPKIFKKILSYLKKIKLTFLASTKHTSESTYSDIVGIFLGKKIIKLMLIQFYLCENDEMLRKNM